MTTTRTPQPLLIAQAGATVSPIYNLDYRFDPNAYHTFAGILTSGDTITCEASPHVDPTLISGPASAVDVWVTLGSFTSVAFSMAINGSWPRVRSRKTGTAGAATVYVV